MAVLGSTSLISLASVNSNGTGPITFNNSSGVQVGTLCRAWVSFNGTGAVAIRGSFNVTSITDNGGAGDYTVNFTNALSDANYSWAGSAARTSTSALFGSGFTVTANDVVTARTTSLFRIAILVNGGDGNYDIFADSAYVNISVFR